MNCTELVVRWALSRPVLTRWLAEIAQSDHDADELILTIADLLDSPRSSTATAFLRAVGVPLGSAHMARTELTGMTPHWVYAVDWAQVRTAVIEGHRRMCAALCDGPHKPLPQCST